MGSAGDGGAGPAAHLRSPRPASRDLCPYFGIFLNLAWEFLHAPLFRFEQQSSWSSLLGCLLFCSGIDALMMLAAYWTVALIRRDRYWFVRKSKADLVLMGSTALSIAFISEFTAIHYRDLWSYSPWMPVIPVLEVGVSPMLQWIFLPSLVQVLLLRLASSDRSNEELIMKRRDFLTKALLAVGGISSGGDRGLAAADHRYLLAPESMLPPDIRRAPAEIREAYRFATRQSRHPSLHPVLLRLRPRGPHQQCILLRQGQLDSGKIGI